MTESSDTRAALWVTAAAVLMAAIDWLNFERIVLVSYPAAAAPRAGSRP